MSTVTSDTKGRRRDGLDSVEPDKKKRKVGAKKASGFKPQLVQLPNSSDTPPDDEPVNLPPPPSERKIARRRESTRAIRERQPLSPSPPPLSKRAKPASGSSMAESSSGPRPSVAHLPSPQRTISQPAWGSQSVMGPPVGFVRKTRKSMAGGLSAEITSEEMIPISEAETPMIKKNKALREEQSRRSSLGMRGQRASSSLGRGDLSVPHSSVESSAFYTHISSTMPEPFRARHLFVYCADRAFKAELKPPSKSKSRSRKPEAVRTDEGDRLLNEIMAEFCTSVGKGIVDTNVFASGPSKNTGSLRPHPKNVANKAAEQKEHAVIRRCKDECNEWGRLEVEARTARKRTVDQMAKKAKLDRDPDMALANPWMQDALHLAEEVIAAGDGDMTEMGEFLNVEYKVDTLHQSSHAALQFSHQANRFLDGIFSSLTNDLRREPEPQATTIPPTATTKSRATAPRRDPIHMLRALASAESSKPSEEAISLATAAAPVSLSASTSATPRRAGMGATPRRGLTVTGTATATGTTPRRATLGRAVE